MKCMNDEKVFPFFYNFIYHDSDISFACNVENGKLFMFLIDIIGWYELEYVMSTNDVQTHVFGVVIMSPMISWLPKYLQTAKEKKCSQFVEFHFNEKWIFPLSDKNSSF